MIFAQNSPVDPLKVEIEANVVKGIPYLLGAKIEICLLRQLFLLWYYSFGLENWKKKVFFEESRFFKMAATQYRVKNLFKKKHDYFVQPLTSLLSDRFWRFWA